MFRNILNDCQNVFIHFKLCPQPPCLWDLLFLLEPLESQWMSLKCRAHERCLAAPPGGPNDNHPVATEAVRPPPQPRGCRLRRPPPRPRHLNLEFLWGGGGAARRDPSATPPPFPGNSLGVPATNHGTPCVREPGGWPSTPGSMCAALKSTYALDPKLTTWIYTIMLSPLPLLPLLQCWL